MYCDAKEIRFRNREELTLKSKVKTFLIDILLDIVGGCFIAIGVYNFAVASGFPVAGISGIAIVFYYFWKIPIGTMTTILNIPIILICYKLLGKQFFLRSGCCCSRIWGCSDLGITAISSSGMHE